MKNPSLELNEEEYRTLLFCVDYSAYRAARCIDDIVERMARIVADTNEEEFPESYMLLLENQLKDMVELRERNREVLKKLKRFLREVEELEHSC